MYLEIRYLLSKCSDGGKREYAGFRYDEQNAHLINFAGDGDTYRHGPANLRAGKGCVLSLDQVQCVRCLLWPPQAADWPTQHRNYGWPDSATLDRVVSNGCDVVGVAHRQCIDNMNGWASVSGDCHSHEQKLY